MHLNRSKERFLILETDEGNHSIVNFSGEDQFGAAVNIKYPLLNLNNPNIEASCNGLICIRNYDNEVEEIVIWNPLIRKYKRLPSKPRGNCRTLLAFGYDQVNDDYKVLRSVELEWDKKYSHEVCSLREMSWRMVEEEWPIEAPFKIWWPTHSSNGAFHWAITYETATHLKIDHLTFDLSTEKFRVQAFPINCSIETQVNLMDLGGWLCAFFPKLCEVWVMKEYGVSSSWTLLYAAKPSPTSKILPLVFSHDGEEVLTVKLKVFHFFSFLYWYDIKRKIKRIVQIQNIPQVLYLPYVCVESLLLLDADGCNDLQ